MIELYHNADAVCPFKVRIALAEKGLDWISHIGPDLRSPEYLALNPKGYVPTLIHDGNILVESRIISEYLEEAFPTPALMPDDPVARHTARWWSKQVDDSLHLNVFVLTFLARSGWGIRHLDEAARQRRLPKDPLKRHIALEVLHEDLASVWVPTAIERFRALVLDMAAKLERGQWLAGDTYSLADIDITAYIHRLGQLGLDLLWKDLPAVADWRERVIRRPSYEAGITRWIGDAEAGQYGPKAEAIQSLAEKICESA